MTHEVFISYSHHDKAIADGVCANLEQASIRCWIAPRDIAPGHDWPASISQAIKSSRVFVLIFSSRSNTSEDVSRELILAANSKLIIVPFKIEDIAPEPGKEYYLARTHWLDAMDPPTQGQVNKLVSCVRALLLEAGVKLPLERTPAGTPSGIFPEVDTGSKLPPPQITSSPLPPATKQRKKSHTGLWIVSACLLLLAVGSMLLWTQRTNIPALAGLFASPSPTPTITYTASPSPTQTRTPPPDWQATRQAEIHAFADPILADVLSRRPNHEADFSTYDPKWSGTTEVTFTDGVMHLRSPGGSVDAGGDHIAADDFVIQFDFTPVIMEDTDMIHLGFRQGKGNGIYYDLGLSLGGSWYIYYTSSTTGHQVCDGMAGRTRVGQTRTVLFIAQGGQMAFYLDGQPVGYCQDDSTFSAEWAALMVDSSTGNIEVDFDNIKFWDLNALKP
jgi:hypothetical protein